MFGKEELLQPDLLRLYMFHVHHVSSYFPFLPSQRKQLRSRPQLPFLLQFTRQVASMTGGISATDLSAFLGKVVGFSVKPVAKTKKHCCKAICSQTLLSC